MLNFSGMLWFFRTGWKDGFAEPAEKRDVVDVAFLIS